MEREKRIKSGRLLEVEFYPVFSDGRKIPSRAPKSKKTTEEQAKCNRNRAIKNLVRYVNANFDNTDVFMSPTYIPECAPQSEEEARRNIQNYFRRVKTKRVSELKHTEKMLSLSPYDEKLKIKRKKLREPLRYIYVIEKQVYKSGPYRGKMNFHYHIFMTGGLDRDIMEEMWRGGIRVNTNRFQPERFGVEAAARYCSKDPQGSKSFSGSRNLKRPTVSKVIDGKITPRGVEKLAKERSDDREYWEKRHKGYKFIRCFSRYNNYNGNFYISVIMYKTEEKTDFSPWKTEWLYE